MQVRLQAFEFIGLLHFGQLGINGLPIPFPRENQFVVGPPCIVGEARTE